MSTVNPAGKPQSAVVEFGDTDDLEIIFDTFANARKYKNLQNCKDVSIVVGWDNNITVQYEGKAQELFGEELERCKEIYFGKNPDAKKWDKVGIKYFKVQPAWIRYSDLNKDPWEVFEIEF